MFLKVIAYVYPGVNKSGVAIVRIDKAKVTDVAVGSLDNDIVGPLLEKVKPTEMVVATDRFYSEKHTRVPMPDTVTKFTIARPGWDKAKIPLILDGKRVHGVYTHNVYKIMFRDLMSRSVVINGWNLKRFDREWAMSHAPVELGNVR